MTYGDGKQKPEGTWDFYGACVNNYRYGKVSVGIFQWVKSKNGTKRGKVAKRLSDDSFRNALLIARARKEVIQRNKELK